ncbi:MAG: hypothetical protein AB4352_02965 [Hormoscilla sp.]
MGDLRLNILQIFKSEFNWNMLDAIWFIFGLSKKYCSDLPYHKRGIIEIELLIDRMNWQANFIMTDRTSSPVINHEGAFPSSRALLE